MVCWGAAGTAPTYCMSFTVGPSAPLAPGLSGAGLRPPGLGFVLSRRWPSPPLVAAADDWSRFSPAPPAEVHAAGRGYASPAPRRPRSAEARLRCSKGRAWPLQVVDLLQIKTAPASRPLLTRRSWVRSPLPTAQRDPFLHLFAGMATADEQAEMVRQLACATSSGTTAGPTTGAPGDNAPPTEHISHALPHRALYRPSRQFRRDALRCQLAYTPPGATMLGASGRGRGTPGHGQPPSIAQPTASASPFSPRPTAREMRGVRWRPIPAARPDGIPPATATRPALPAPPHARAPSLPPRPSPPPRQGSSRQGLLRQEPNTRGCWSVSRTNRRSVVAARTPIPARLNALNASPTTSAMLSTTSGLSKNRRRR